MIASEGPAVDAPLANAAPIVSVDTISPNPTLNWEPVAGLPPELQPAPGDVLLAKAAWPWDDLGAQGVPEHWLYMSRRIQGTVAMLAVQTPAGPKLVKADSNGQLFVSPSTFPAGSLVAGGQQNIAAASDTSALPGVAGQHYRIFSIRFINTGAISSNIVRFNRANGNAVYLFSLGTGVVQDVSFTGYDLAQGEALIFHNYDPVNPANVFIEVSYLIIRDV